ncbi:MAG TPA: PrsW family glutamic-type intramembrane protease [Thermoanaerobaculia bacterium]|nr:PrsW family glutamic-type intramembrane protease [Thermoanaerobaculia bacterium]
MSGGVAAGLVIRFILGFIPVCLFLSSLVYLDSYKLVRLRTLLQLVAIGCIAAGLSYVANQTLLGSGVIERWLLTRVTAPLLEEILKALPILFLLRTRRVGFLVDAAIFGFAVGTGFALAENVYYLWALSGSSPTLWVVRGFGTAVMHGGTTAIFAMITKTFFERKESEAMLLAFPGLVAAFAIHSFFNQFLFSPTVSAVAVIVVLPPLLAIVFGQSERYLRSWLGSEFDVDAELLEALRSGEFLSSRPGRYLQSVRERFDGVVMADMLCYLRLQTELSLQAKGMLIMKESGLPIRKDVEINDKIAELQFLRESIGKTGALALSPILPEASHARWQLHMLAGGE